MPQQRRLPWFAPALLSAVALLNSSPAQAQLSVGEMSQGGRGVIEPFLGGEWVTIEAPPGGVLQDFRLPAHNGRVRVGGGLNYMKNRNVGSVEQSQRMLGAFIQRSSYQLYIDLLALDENKVVFTQENLANLYTARRNRGTVVRGAAGWPDLFIWTARGGLSDDSYRDAFCSDAVPCPIDVFQAPRPFQLGNRRQGEAKVLWGNATNEFEFQAAYEHFVQTYAQPLIDWGSTIPRDVAVVSSVRMPTYDFNKGSYDFQLRHPIITLLPEGFPLEVSTPEYDLAIHLEAGTRRIAAVTLSWKLDREAAEALRNAMTERQVNTFYVLAEGTIGFQPIDREGMNTPLALATSQQVTLTGTEFTFFFDEELTEEAGRFSTVP